MDYLRLARFQSHILGLCARGWWFRFHSHDPFGLHHFVQVNLYLFFFEKFPNNITGRFLAKCISPVWLSGGKSSATTFAIPRWFGCGLALSNNLPKSIRCTPDRCFFIVVCLYDFPMLRLFFPHFHASFLKIPASTRTWDSSSELAEHRFSQSLRMAAPLLIFCRSWAASVSVFSMRSPPAHIWTNCMHSGVREK